MAEKNMTGKAPHDKEHEKPVPQQESAGAVNETPEDFRALNDRCVEAFHEYIKQGEKTWALIGSLNPRVSFEQWGLLIDQRQNENHAHEFYQHAREKMFVMLRPSEPAVINPNPIAAPTKTST